MTIDELVAEASSSPATALEKATRQLPEASGRDRAVNLYALGLAQRNLGDAKSSVTSLRAALDAAGNDSALAGNITASLSGSLGFVGEFDEAMALLDGLLEGHDDGLLLARAQHQRATLLQRAGDSAGAIEGYERALAVLQEFDDKTFEGHLHMNVSILLTYEGRIERALAELDRADEAYRAANDLKWSAICTHNRGWTIGSTGDLPGALALFDEADDRLADLGVPPGPRLAIRAEVLLRAGLVERARNDLSVALDELERLGLETDRAETLVLASRAALQAGDTNAGSALAEAAAELLRSQQRPGWALLAQAAAVESKPDALSEEQVVDLGHQLQDAGHSMIAVEVSSAAARSLLERGHADHAGRILDQAPHVDLTAAERVALALAHARLLAVQEAVPEALDVCEGAYVELDRFLNGLGSLDLIAGAARHLDELVELARRLTSRDPRGFLRWSARRKLVGSWRWPRQKDAGLGPLLDRYRGMAARLADEPNDQRLRSELAELQRQLEDANWTQTNRPESNHRNRSDQAGVNPLEGTVCIDLSSLEDQVIESRVDDRGQVQQSTQGVDRELVSATDRTHRVWMASAGATSGVLESRTRLLTERLEAQLFPTPLPPAKRLVLAADPEFRSVPFSALPGLRQRSFAISLWQAHEPIDSVADATSGQRLLIADPDLQSAVAERRSLLANGSWTEPSSLAIDAVLDALGNCQVAHIATHGGVEPRNPMFNWLGIPGGRMFLYDLTRLETAPEGVVISACLGARSQSYGAAGPLSFAEAFLGAGCRWVIASTSVVPDTAGLASFVGALHAALGTNPDPAEALFAARRQAEDQGLGRIASAFCCYVA